MNNMQNWHVIVWKDAIPTMIVMDVVECMYSC